MYFVILEKCRCEKPGEKSRVGSKNERSDSSSITSITSIGMGDERRGRVNFGKCCVNLLLLDRKTCAGNQGSFKRHSKGSVRFSSLLLVRIMDEEFCDISFQACFA